MQTPDLTMNYLNTLARGQVRLFKKKEKTNVIRYVSLLVHEVADQL